MKDLLDKLSSYNLFNYLLPGVIFVMMLNHFTAYNLIQKDLITGVFLYYFLGMVVSRFGSVIIEPLLKKIKFLKFSDYKKFVSASQKDTKIELLSEVNNTYRTVTSMLILLFAVKLYHFAGIKIGISHQVSRYLIVCVILLMFLFSYRKQTNYINARVEANP